MMSFKVKLISLLLAFGLLLVIGTVLTNYTMLKNSLIDYVDLRDQQHLQRIKNNMEFIIREKNASDLNFIDELTWQRIVSISGRVDFGDTFLPVDMFFDYPFANFKEVSPDFAQKRLCLLDKYKACLFGYANVERPLLIDLENHRGELVGYIGYTHRAELTETLDIQLAERQRSLLTYGVLIVVVMSGLLLIPFARAFLSPIQAVTEGMRKLTAGQLKTRLKIDRKDEIGQLQQDFNHLASSLEKNQRSRNQWIADISHELRTPLTILRGDIEALKDGIRPFNEKTLDHLHSEILHLNRLVDDLYQITLNDAGGLRYQMKSLDFIMLLQHHLDSYADNVREKGLVLKTELPDHPLKISGDADRLQQMLNNILANSLAYTDVPGLIYLRVFTDGQQLTLELEDSAPGVSDEGISRLFERFFRGEISRNRRYGGAGIGLAIVEQIVHAHQGQIYAEHSPLGGIKITLTLPLETFPR